MQISDKKVKSMFKKASVKVSNDGIGNCDISFVWNDGYSIQHITLGGYCDMEPFKWGLAEGWKVGKDKTGYGSKWSVTALSTRYVDQPGSWFESEDREYYWDSDYVEEILRLKEKLATLLPMFKETTDRIHEEIVKDMYEFSVTQVNGLFRTKHPKWIGKVMFRGKLHKTEKFDNFFDAKKAADGILELMRNLEYGKNS